MSGGATPSNRTAALLHRLDPAFADVLDDGAHDAEGGLDVEVGARQCGAQLAQAGSATAQVEPGDDTGGGFGHGAKSRFRAERWDRPPTGARPGQPSKNSSS